MPLDSDVDNSDEEDIADIDDELSNQIKTRKLKQRMRRTGLSLERVAIEDVIHGV